MAEINVSDAVKASSRVDDQLQTIFMEHFGVTATEGEEADAGYKAYASLAVDVAVRMANVFLAIRRPKEHRTYRAICDLTFELNANKFWERNASVLLPVVHVCLNTYRDGLDLLVEREAKGEYSTHDTLIAGSRAAPLEIFPLIAYLVGGSALMLKASVPMKLALTPYFIE